MSEFNKYLVKTDSATFVAWLIIAFTLLPFLFLCVFNVPLGDDFWYANGFRRHGMVETQMVWYKEWSGRYMATFLISTLNPLSYGIMNLGYIHPFVMILGTFFSLKFLINTIVDSFKLSINKILTLAIMLFFYMNYIPDVGESFYWMAGAYTYQVPVIFLFLYIALLIKIYRDSSATIIKVLYVIAALLSLFIIIGSNEVIVVYVCCLNSLLAIYIFFKKKIDFLKFLPLLIITIVLSYNMIFAQGNFTRADLFVTPQFHLIKAVAQSLSRGIFVLVFWIPTILLMLLSIPKVSTITISSEFLPQITSKSRLQILILSTIVLILIIFTGFFPSIYTTNWIPQRAYTPIFVVFIIAFVCLFVVMLKYFPILTRLNNNLSNFPKTSNVFLCILIVAFAHNSNVMNAYVDLTSGKASTYYNQVMKTYYALENNTQDTIYVQALEKKPLILPIRWAEKNGGLANSIWEGYFDIKKVDLE